MAKNKMNKRVNIRNRKGIGKKDRRPKPQAEEYDVNATTPNRAALRLIKEGG